MRRIPFGVLILQLIASGVAESQTFDDVQVLVKGYRVESNGGEKFGVAMSTGPVVIGERTTAVFSVGGCIPFTVSSRGAFVEGATTGWSAEVTPTRVADQAVTFKLRWVRGLHNGKGDTGPGEDIELTLRPGESRPLDSVPVPSGGTNAGGSCQPSAASLRVTADFHPIDEWDRRLIAVDLWLIERLPNGGERSQPLSVRGLPNRPMPFYFDSIVDGVVTLDLLGQVVARPESGAIEVKLQTRSRWGSAPPGPIGSYRMAGNNTARWVDSVIHVKPGEIVEVGLPRLSDFADAFANRVFSIRIRARQVR